VLREKFRKNNLLREKLGTDRDSCAARSSAGRKENR
jgi:hypothetical protein